MQPGDTITPGQQPPQEQLPEPVVSAQQPPVQAVSPQPTVEVQIPRPAVEQNPAEAVTQQPTPPPVASSAPQANWAYKNDASGTQAQDTTQAQPQAVTVGWTASEYIAHDKGAGWYLILALGVILFSGLIYLLTKEIFSVAVIVLIGASFGIFAARKPKELDYAVDMRGIHIGQRTYGFDQFKSFSLIVDGPVHSIVLMPLQRFMMPITVYFDPSDEDKITDTLSLYLPYVQRELDYVDRLMKKVRF